MKKVLVFLFAITLSLGVFAQDSTSATNNMNQKPRMQKHDGVIMKDGKLLMMKDGQTTPLTTDLTLDNGAVVTTDGRVKSKDGTVTTLNEGDYVTIEGTPGNISKWHQKDNMKKDSAR